MLFEVSAVALGCPGLKLLNLTCTQITDGALFHLAAWSKRLEYIGLSNIFWQDNTINITDAGIFVLASCCPLLRMDSLPYNTSTRGVETARALTGRSVYPRASSERVDRDRSKTQGLVLAWSRTFLPRDSHVEAYRKYLEQQQQRQRDSHVTAYWRHMHGGLRKLSSGAYVAV